MNRYSFVNLSLSFLVLFGVFVTIELTCNIHFSRLLLDATMFFCIFSAICAVLTHFVKDEKGL